MESKGIRAVFQDLNSDRLPFQDNYFDLVLLSEVIEHLVNPDNALKEAHRVLKSNGILIVTTPNLSSWMNRVYLLFGYQPPDAETSTQVRVGNPWRDGSLSGHIRPFTVRALKELLIHYGFSVEVRGFSHERTSLPYPIYLMDAILSKISSLAHWIVIVSVKR